MLVITLFHDISRWKRITTYHFYRHVGYVRQTRAGNSSFRDIVNPPQVLAPTLQELSKVLKRISKIDSEPQITHVKGRQKASGDL